MVRAAAKNHPSVAVVVSPSSYDEVLAAVRAGGTTLEQRKALAAQAFRHTASYDVAVASWMGNVLAPDGDPWPGWVGATWQRADVLRYGENPHQRAALYVDEHFGGGLASAQQLHGKQMSYNNYVDTDAALAGGVRLRRARASRSSSTPTRAASPSAPTSPRRTARRTPATRCRRSAASSRSTGRCRSRWPSRSPTSSPR